MQDLSVNFDVIGNHTLNIDGKSFQVEIIDSVKDYVELMKEIFDFPLLKDFVQDFKIIANGMNGSKFLLFKILC